MKRSIAWGLVGLCAFVVTLEAADAAPSTKRVSVSKSGAQGTGASQFSDITPNGKFIAFQSSASNLVSGDTCCSDIFRRTRTSAGSIVRVSLGPGNRAANNFSQSPVISDNGNRIAFRSAATNLVDADANGITYDIYVREVSTGITTLVSVSSSGIQANGASACPVISGNGRLVAFRSSATNLVSDDTNQKDDIFVRDLVNGTTRRVSLTANGGQADDHSGCDFGEAIGISLDGKRIVFKSNAQLTQEVQSGGLYNARHRSQYHPSGIVP